MRAELVTNFESEHFRQFNSVGVCVYTHTYLLTIFF